MPDSINSTSPHGKPFHICACRVDCYPWLTICVNLSDLLITDGSGSSSKLGPSLWSKARSLFSNDLKSAVEANDGPLNKELEREPEPGYEPPEILGLYNYGYSVKRQFGNGEMEFMPYTILPSPSAEDIHYITLWIPLICDGLLPPGDRFPQHRTCYWDSWVYEWHLRWKIWPTIVSQCPTALRDYMCHYVWPHLDGHHRHKVQMYGRFNSIGKYQVGDIGRHRLDEHPPLTAVAWPQGYVPLSSSQLPPTQPESFKKVLPEVVYNTCRAESLLTSMADTNTVDPPSTAPTGATPAGTIVHPSNYLAFLHSQQNLPRTKTFREAYSELTSRTDTWGTRDICSFVSHVF